MHIVSPLGDTAAVDAAISYRPFVLELETNKVFNFRWRFRSCLSQPFQQGGLVQGNERSTWFAHILSFQFWAVLGLSQQSGPTTAQWQRRRLRSICVVSFE